MIEMTHVLISHLLCDLLHRKCRLLQQLFRILHTHLDQILLKRFSTIFFQDQRIIVPLHADVEGAGKLAAFGSANPITKENYTTGDFTSYRGVATAIVQSGYEAGVCTLTVSGEGFEAKSVGLEIK